MGRKMKNRLLILTIVCLCMSSCVGIHEYRYLNHQKSSVVVQDCDCFNHEEIFELQDRLQYFYLGNKKVYFLLRRIEPGGNETCHSVDCMGLFLCRGGDSRTGMMWEYPVIKLSDTILTPMSNSEGFQSDSIQMLNMLMEKLSPPFDSSTVKTIWHRFVMGRRRVATWRALY